MDAFSHVIGLDENLEELALTESRSEFYNFILTKADAANEGLFMLPALYDSVINRGESLDIAVAIEALPQNIVQEYNLTARSSAANARSALEASSEDVANVLEMIEMVRTAAGR